VTIHGIRLGTRPHEYIVPSTSDPTKEYHVYKDLGKCTCKGFVGSKHCKHFGMVDEYIAEMEGGREPEEEAPERFCPPPPEEGGMVVPPPPAQNFSKWIVTIHGKETIRYQGLLAMAHEQGLVKLGARFTSITAELAVAWAWAYFKDGRQFTESGEATPTNVQAGVRAAWARMALTRAKARVLRDALNIGIVALEELED